MALTVIPRAMEAQQRTAPVHRLLSEMGAAYYSCPTRINTAVMGWQIQQLKSDTPIARDSLMDRVHACPDSVAGVMDTLYRATKRQRLGPVAASLLKDIYAEWKVDLSEMIPTGAETSETYAKSYSRRMDAVSQEFRRKAERLKLELE